MEDDLQISCPRGQLTAIPLASPGRLPAGATEGLVAAVLLVMVPRTLF